MKLIKLAVSAVALSLLCGPVVAQVKTVSGNFPRDLLGPQDVRMAGALCAGQPCIWGCAASEVLPIKFNPPPGYRVRILRLRGDLVSWIKVLPGDAPVPDQTSAGVLLGFATTAKEASVECDWCADNTFLYVQDVVTEKHPGARTPFDYADVDRLLEADNTLNLVIAAWLNTTGKPIHLEGTYTIKFVYEPEQQASVR